MSVNSSAPQAELIQNEHQAREIARRLLGRKPLPVGTTRTQAITALVADNLANPRVSTQLLDDDILPAVPLSLIHI